MTVREIQLSTPAEVVFPDGVRMQVSYLPEKSSSLVASTGGTEGWGRFSFPTATLELRGAVDDGETVDEPRIHVVSGSSPDQLFVFGGPQAYTLASRGCYESELALYREPRWAEYWDTHFHQLPTGLVIVYESGILVLDSTFQVRRHERKRLNDTLESLEGGSLRMKAETGETWSWKAFGGA